MADTHPSVQPPDLRPKDVVLRLAVLGLKKRVITYEYLAPGMDWHEVKVNDFRTSQFPDQSDDDHDQMIFIISIMMISDYDYDDSDDGGDEEKEEDDAAGMSYFSALILFFS
jgi:hypothetical protein